MAILLCCLFAIGDIPVDTDAGDRVLLDVPATDTDAGDRVLLDVPATDTDA